MIEAKEITLTYQDGTQALKDINLEIKPGELVYITGPSGSGKTSLLKLLMGMEYPTSGSLMVLGQPMSKRQERKIRKLRRRIGPVFQEFKLIEGRTALENVMMGMRFLGISPRKMKAEAISALNRVGLEHKMKSRVEHLSWGEAQRVAIARAVARKPELILADEPTGNLDHDNALKILELLTSFMDGKTSVVITTHATHLIEGQENATYLRVKNGTIAVERRGRA
ncbi:MAG TPA: ATP-binding cassette domain-containing protein [Mobilitalea sp.]|nr:ATP-binding cassette domain-containing protein [Mobilitalea sp.]